MIVPASLMMEPVTSKNSSPEGSDFTDSEWSLAFPDDAEKTRVLTPEPTFRDAPQKGSPSSIDDERYQSFHPNFEFTRDFTPQSTASHNSSGSRYTDDMYECHRSNIIGHSTPPIQAVFDTVIMGHTSDRSWSSNQSYWLTESTTSSDSSQFVFLSRPGTSSGQKLGFKGTGLKGPDFNSHPVQRISINNDSKTKKQCSPRAEHCLPPSNVPKEGRVNEKKEVIIFGSPKSEYDKRGTERHRTNTMEGLLSDKGIRSASSQSSSSSNSQKRSLIPVRTTQECIVMRNGTNTKKVSKGEKCSDIRKSISITSPESLYVFQESGSDRHRASTLEGLFSDTDINSSEYESTKPRCIPNKSPARRDTRPPSQIPIRTKLPDQIKKSGTQKACKYKDLATNSPDSVYAFEESGSERHRTSTLEGLFSETESSSYEENENHIIASSKVPKNRDSQKRSKIPQRVTPPHQQHLYLDKVAFICGASNDVKGDKNKRLRESTSVTSPESLYVFEESGSDRHRASTLEGLFSDPEITSSENENGRPRTQVVVPQSDRFCGNPSKIPLRFTPPRHETFLDRIAYICGAVAPHRNTSTATTTEYKTTSSGEAATETLKTKKRDQSDKIAKQKIQKPQSKANESLVITSFQKRKDYETKRKAEMQSVIQRDEKKMSMKKKKDDPMNITELDLQKIISIQTGKPVDVQNIYNVKKSVDVHKPIVDNLGLPANGFKMVRQDAHDKSKFRYITCTEHQDFSSLQKENDALYECSQRDILDFKPSFEDNKRKNLKPVTCVDSGRKKMTTVRPDINAQMNKESTSDKGPRSSCFPNTTGKNILPPIPLRTQKKPVGMSRYLNGKPKREHNVGICSAEKEESDENVRYNSSHKNKHSSYTYVAPKKVAKVKNVLCSVVVNSKEKTTAGYVPGYGSVRVNPASVQPVLKPMVEKSIDEPRNVSYPGLSSGQRAENRAVSDHRPTPGEVSGSVKLPPINSRQIADSRGAKGKKSNKANTLESRTKPLNAGVGKGLSRELHRQYPMFY